MQAIALGKCVEEGVSHMWTVSAIQLHPKGIIVCDEDATLELHVKVIAFFTFIILHLPKTYSTMTKKCN